MKREKKRRRKKREREKGKDENIGTICKREREGRKEKEKERWLIIHSVRICHLLLFLLLFIGHVYFLPGTFSLFHACSLNTYLWCFTPVFFFFFRFFCLRQESFGSFPKAINIFTFSCMHCAIIMEKISE